MSVPKLYPVYLPFPSQHKLLVKVQTLLEAACYRFASIRLRNLLEAERWGCAESIELNIWSKSFRSTRDEFTADKLKEIGKPLPDLLDAIAHLRHTAVHRIPISANRVIQFMVDAESLAKLLEDDACAKLLFHLRMATEVTIDELRRNKDLLELVMTENLKKFAIQRAELKRLEREAVESMLREDSQFQKFSSLSLEEAIASTEKTPDIVKSGETKSIHTNILSAVDLNSGNSVDYRVKLLHIVLLVVRVLLICYC